MIAVLDIGKTNKKCFVFDEDYRIVYEKTAQLPGTVDEDGEPCEDLNLLKNWGLDSVREILNDRRFEIRALNVATYGASLVHVDADGQPLTPLYNYLKPFPADLEQWFFATYGGAAGISLETASPVLGNLNSGLQVLWLKHRRPEVFNRIKYALHLPQYIASLLNGRYVSEITSIGCHTMLWDFQKNDYHTWVEAEGIDTKFPPLHPSNDVFPIHQQINESTNQQFAGLGLHDSSASLIPYLACFEEPFVLISTGTWCISLNPFNPASLTADELRQDCLCYLSYTGQAVKAARYFGGFEHEQAVKELAAAFGQAEDFYRSARPGDGGELSGRYLQFMRQLVEKQAASTRLALGASPVRRIFVDGGFSKNDTYLALLAEAFPEMEVFSAEIAQATALGAAMAIHPHWNSKPLPRNLISLKPYHPLPL